MDGKIFAPTVPNTWVQETHTGAVKCQHTFTKHTHITVYQELNPRACAQNLLLLVCCFQALWEKEDTIFTKLEPVWLHISRTV